MYLYGDKTIKMDRDSAEVLPRESLALVVSTCGENPFVWYRLLVVRRPVVVSALSIGVSMAVIGSKSAVGLQLVS